GLDGVQKMSKSLDNYIGIAETPRQIFWKAMSIPDKLILRYLELVTDASLSEINAERQALETGENPRDVKMRLAKRLVKMLYGPQAANEAEVTFGFVDEFAIPERAVSAESRSIAQLFIDAKLVSSKSEARRLAS